MLGHDASIKLINGFSKMVTRIVKLCITIRRNCLSASKCDNVVVITSYSYHVILVSARCPNPSFWDLVGLGGLLGPWRFLLNSKGLGITLNSFIKEDFFANYLIPLSLYLWRIGVAWLICIPVSGMLIIGPDFQIRWWSDSGVQAAVLRLGHGLHNPQL